MNLVNRRFQDLLKERNFPMKMVEEEGCYIYKGRLSVDQAQIVDFAVSLSNNDENLVGQIVFNNIAYLPEHGDKSVWLEMINQLNLHHGLYYYFAIDNDNRVFARYVTELSFEVDEFFHVLTRGGQIVRHAISKLAETVI